MFWQTMFRQTSNIVNCRLPSLQSKDKELRGLGLARPGKPALDSNTYLQFWHYSGKHAPRISGTHCLSCTAG